MRRIRSLDSPDLARTPGVALTAYTRAGDGQLALAVGFQLYVAKPVDPAELVRVVVQAVEAGAPRQE